MHDVAHSWYIRYRGEQTYGSNIDIDIHK